MVPQITMMTISVGDGTEYLARLEFLPKGFVIFAALLFWQGDDDMGAIFIGCGETDIAAVRLGNEFRAVSAKAGSPSFAA